MARKRRKVSSSSLTILPSSPQSAKTIGSSPIRTPSTSTPTHLYRQVKTLPYELREYVLIHFEEGLYSQALNFLKILLESGTISPDPRRAILPPSHCIAFIATLAIHPTLTTRAKSLERLEASNLAIQYLHLALRHCGPVTDDLQGAFTFSQRGKTNRRGTASRRRMNSEEVSPIADLDDSIASELADAKSVWVRADDFWHTVGWGFNCSISHKRRWEHWREWLDFMISLLETDWSTRKEYVRCGTLEESLIVKYVNSGGAATGRERKILRAVFADGRTKAVAEFGEVWPNETKALKKENGVKKAERKIDIEADNYGDYMEDENASDLEESESDSSPPSTEYCSTGSISDIADDLGGLESINLRVRLLSLLSRVSDALPDAFTSLNSLYHVFFEHIRPLPIYLFFTIMSPAGLRPFEPTAASTLTQYILRSIIAAAAPLPPNDNLSQEILEAHYLPFAANTNTLIDNTKVSLCIETLLRLLDQYVGLEWTSQFHDRAEAGIQARTSKIKGKRSKKSTDGDGACDMSWLSSSTDRIRLIIKMAKSQALASRHLVER